MRGRRRAGQAYVRNLECLKASFNLPVACVPLLTGAS